MRTIWLSTALVALVLSSCAGVDPVDESAPRVVYYETTNPALVRSELEYEGFGGAVLGYVQYENEVTSKNADTAFVYLHGIQSHAGWFDGPSYLLCDAGYAVYCLDRRGSGINRENRGFPSGDVLRYEIYLKDIKAFMAPLRQRYRRVFLIGLSWGGKLATAYGLAHPEDMDGLVLITPGLNSKVDLTATEKIEVGIGSVAEPTVAVPIPIAPEMFTSDAVFLDKMERDPLSLRQATARFFLQGVNMDKFILENIERNEIPILLFLAGQDRIIDNDGVLDLLGRGAAKPEVREYADQTHSIQFDAPVRFVADVTAWVDAK